jgi:hypothetical protein
LGRFGFATAMVIFINQNNPPNPNLANEVGEGGYIEYPPSLPFDRSLSKNTISSLLFLVFA